MTSHTFYKYQGAGNDFVIFDGRASGIAKRLEQSTIAHICDRRFGIGGDGLMVLDTSDEYDFKMVYFNSDGRPSSMCGNGGRCLVAFAQKLGVINNRCRFIAVDGPHQAQVEGDTIALQMNDVRHIDFYEGHPIIDTGSPHIIKVVDDLDGLDIIKEAHAIRYNDHFHAEGINVNFCSFDKDRLSIRTYERGVENETLACGTGATAAAIFFGEYNDLEGKHDIPVKAQGGDLSVKFNKTDKGYKDVWLCGPGEFVFEGLISL